MAENKSDHFSVKKQRLSVYAQALSHPAKVAILELLSENGSMTCGEITGRLPLAQATVSQHLNNLILSGLVVRIKDGLKSNYSLKSHNIDQMRTLIYEVMNKLSNPL